MCRTTTPIIISITPNKKGSTRIHTGMHMLPKTIHTTNLPEGIRAIRSS